jgi:hypothetical protein
MSFIRRWVFLPFVFAGLLPAGSAFAQIQSEMKLFSDSFISPSFEATQKTNYQFVGASLKTDEKSQDPLRMDISGAVAFGEPLLNYLNISEFYYENKFADAQQTLTLGRRKMLWNELDARWNFGIWEPVFKWNPLSPERQGLSGLFWQVDRPLFSMMLFASPIYLPDQGPSYEIENGAFVRGNPWFSRPPDSIHIFGETTPIEYNLQRPNDSQVVFQTSYGGRLSFGDPKALLFQMSYIYKPSNQLALGYDGVLDLTKDKGEVNILPEVFYHSLTGADLSYAFANVRLGASAIYDRPSHDKIFDDQWTHPVFHDAFLSTEFIEMKFRFISLYVQRLDINGGDVTEEGDLADPSRRPLMIVYPFKQANEVGLRGHVSFAHFRHVEATLSYTQSDKNDFSMVKFNTQVNLSNMWSLYGEMQLINAGALTVDNQNDIAQYANNDRYMIGAAYAF